MHVSQTVEPAKRYKKKEKNETLELSLERLVEWRKRRTAPTIKCRTVCEPEPLRQLQAHRTDNIGYHDVMTIDQTIDWVGPQVDRIGDAVGFGICRELDAYQPNWAQADNGDGVARLDLATVDAKLGRGHGIDEQQRVFVGEVLGDRADRTIRIWKLNEFGLATLETN